MRRAGAGGEGTTDPSRRTHCHGFKTGFLFPISHLEVQHQRPTPLNLQQPQRPQPHQHHPRPSDLRQAIPPKPRNRPLIPRRPTLVINRITPHPRRALPRQIRPRYKRPRHPTHSMKVIMAMKEPRARIIRLERNNTIRLACNKKRISSQRISRHVISIIP